MNAMRSLLRSFVNGVAAIAARGRIPAPPFRACKRTGTIMYGVWYGRMTPEQAREKAAAWGIAPETVKQMIAAATQPPSYWSGQSPPNGDHE